MRSDTCFKLLHELSELKCSKIIVAKTRQAFVRYRDNLFLFCWRCERDSHFQTRLCRFIALITTKYKKDCRQQIGGGKFFNDV